MPKNIKITKDTILKAAFSITRKKGIQALNARVVAKHLKCSTQPIYSQYNNMNTLIEDVYQKVDHYHASYFTDIAFDQSYFKHVGFAYIKFALDEPKLFSFLFDGTYSKKHTFSDSITLDKVERLLQVLNLDTSFSVTYYHQVFINMWVYAHGLAAMIVNHQIELTEQQLTDMIDSVYQSLLNKKGE